MQRCVVKATFAALRRCWETEMELEEQVEVVVEEAEAEGWRKLGDFADL